MDVPNPIHAEMPIEEARRRLRWRARRGLLENDLMLQKFFVRHGDSLQMDEIIALMDFLEMSDNDLMDLFLARKDLDPATSSEVERSLLARIRTTP